jgi:hypothetical protein
MLPDLARQLRPGYYAAFSATDAQVGRVLDEPDRPWKRPAFSDCPPSSGCRRLMGYPMRTDR